MINLIRNSIHIPEGGCEVYWSQDGKTETLVLPSIRSKFNGHYAVNNSTICYVYRREVYVTPWTQSAERTLLKAGLSEENFYVPFSNWDYPKNEEQRWVGLWKKAMESYILDYEANCAKWCCRHHIGALAENTMRRCFRIPSDGISVKHPLYETDVYPACGGEICMDSTVEDKLGRYCSNNGKVVFVYRDGHTYVARGYWILSELKDAGYTEGSLFVPFSNGEIIVDPVLAKRWEDCK